jgi:hypothetical protein
MSILLLLYVDDLHNQCRNVACSLAYINRPIMSILLLLYVDEISSTYRRRSIDIISLFI